eukprot:5804056-Pleurochrysis_carterae.AAC.1
MSVHDASTELGATSVQEGKVEAVSDHRKRPVSTQIVPQPKCRWLDAQSSQSKTESSPVSNEASGREEISGRLVTTNAAASSAEISGRSGCGNVFRDRCRGNRDCGGGGRSSVSGSCRACSRSGVGGGGGGGGGVGGSRRACSRSGAG